MKNTNKGIVAPIVIIILIIGIAAIGYIYLQVLTPVGPSEQTDAYLDTINISADKDVITFTHSSRGYDWALEHPRRYLLLTDANATGPFIDWAIREDKTCKINVSAPAREKTIIDERGIDSVYNKFIEDQEKALATLGKTGAFIVKKPLGMSIGNLDGVMFEYAKSGLGSTNSGTRNITYISKYPGKSLIAAFVLECHSTSAIENEFTQYRKEFVNMINSFR
jgi:hypothetical protein